MSSYKFYIRDYRGDVIYTEADIIGHATNIIVEAIAVLNALQFRKVNHFNNIMLESDFLSIMKFVKGE